ncbi:MAG: hypothetical protein CML45_00615 [Rhodobacteraceae bacterium]|nr:hypothetical protein [Paracoccaceae bacterium]
MFKVPLKELEKGSVKKAAIKSKSYILNDKIVNSATQPTLFNVQSAATAMEVTMGNVSLRARRRNAVTETDLAKLSMETLVQMNVAIDPLQKDFSLLSQNTFIAPDPNPYVMDKELIDNIENAPSDIKNHFPSDNDPILQLDEGNNNPVEYGIIQKNGNFTAAVDLSKILSEMNILNQSPDYYGKNKYF